jgi:hypothetical protein
MTGQQRCDEIIRLIDKVLGDAGALKPLSDTPGQVRTGNKGTVR